jgi:hypothetical protein
MSAMPIQRHAQMCAMLTMTHRNLKSFITLVTVELFARASLRRRGGGQGAGAQFIRHRRHVTTSTCSPVT